ncbi:alpha/beta hydrolase [Actinomadura macrotermitis]|uniref:DUF1023 domain-containing protein n=1 Tax=Actinomadura macrotermitis TaxID=2585200 RepID=A0A7K0C618_9ACTN|nr:alpha/beta hydrolase [Actinomadura macrotermitis]MQY08264.1 hypothetical protein [Actinomadura macrotermitis]
MRRFLAVSAVLAVTGSLVGAPGIGYAAPTAPTTIQRLPAHYAAVRQDIERAADLAATTHDATRARTLRAFLAPGRRFLAFDARGHGRAVEAVGDPATADRVAVVVPGADGGLADFDSWKWAGGGARALAAQARSLAPGTRLAVIAWLGYDSPSTLGPGVLTTGAADAGAGPLRALLTDLHRVNGRARFALLCHSYGSVLCGRAAPRLPAGLPVDEIALYGSPGTTARSASALSATAAVWAGRARGDWMRHVPHVRVGGLGFGRDPVSPAFGALRFDAGAGPHSAYLKPGSTALRNLTWIALGRDGEVARAA